MICNYMMLKSYLHQQWRFGLLLKYLHPDNDLNLLILKFNRKGKYIGFQERLLNISMFTHRHVNYKNWIITGYKDFFKLNQGSVKHLSIQGIPIAPIVERPVENE